MPHRVPQTRTASRCPEPSRINVHISFERTWPLETVLAPLMSFSSPTLQILSCCFRPSVTSRPQDPSSNWLRPQPVGWLILYLSLFRGNPKKGEPPYTSRLQRFVVLLHYTSMKPSTSYRNQHILPFCFSVLSPDV